MFRHSPLSRRRKGPLKIDVFVGRRNVTKFVKIVEDTGGKHSGDRTQGRDCDLRVIIHPPDFF